MNNSCGYHQPTMPDELPTHTLELRQLRLRFGLQENTSLRLVPGITALIGPNGAGKSSLLRAMAGLSAKQEILEGEVLWAGKNIRAWNTMERARG
jgi:iron complex transport system ATP-binding protein